MGPKSEVCGRDIPQALALGMTVLWDGLKKRSPHLKELVEVDAASRDSKALRCPERLEFGREGESCALAQITGQFQERDLQDGESCVLCVEAHATQTLKSL